MQIGLSEANADALGVRPGDRIPLRDDRSNAREVRVSGVFRAVDDTDPGWRSVPGLLRPAAGVDGLGSNRFAGLLSRGSLPDARLAVDQDQLQRTVWFTPDPTAFDSGSAGAIAAAVVNLKARSGSSSRLDGSLKWQTGLDTVLRDVRAQVATASTQASVLLIGFLTVAVLVLLLTADAVNRRRVPALAAARQRGAALPDIGAELLIESVAVAVVAAAVGLAAARTVAPGAAWGWTLPVLLTVAGAGPVLGVRTAADATRARAVPANRATRAWARRTGQLRRAAAEVALLIAAVAAFVALHQRGLLPAADDTAGPGSGQDGGATLPASAPTLAVLVASLVLLRLLPAAVDVALARALRSRRPLAVFGAARAAATAGRMLPLLVLVTAAALAGFAVTVRATAERGLSDGAWRTVGADARVEVAPAAEASTPELARRIAAAPGVRRAVAGRVTDGVRVRAAGTVVRPRLVVVDAVAFRRLRSGTPLPDEPALDRLPARGSGDVPVLVGSDDGGLRPGMALDLLRDAAPAVRLVAVGTAAAIGLTGDVVLVDAATVAAAGIPTDPNTVWVTGPGSARAVTANAVAGDTVLRADVLRDRRAAPLTSGLLWLTFVTAAALLALGSLGLVVGTTAAAPDRWQTVTRLRTLGLRPRDTRWIVAGELLPPVAVAALGGPLLGASLAWLTLDPLGLRVLTGQTTGPAPALPWWGLALVAGVPLVTVAVVVPVESALRRRRRLSEVLRIAT
ncbi:FtsX-like permease family protein [Micromonospora zhanjiangensis]